MKLRNDLDIELDKIYHILNNSESIDSNIGFLSGLGGIALFNFKYSEYLETKGLETQKYYEEANLLLEEAIERIDSGYNYPTYCSGIAGYAWLLSYLDSNDYIEIEANELFDVIDEYLFKNMLVDIKNENFDFLHGALGTIFYFLEQYKKNENEKYRKYIDCCLKEIINHAIELDRGVAWLGTVKGEKKTYNLSLSHGISSNISILAILSTYESFNKIIGDTLKKAVQFILSYKIYSKDSTSLLPTFVTIDNIEIRSSRLAWCYGDLGIAIALWNYCLITKEESLKNEVLEIARFSALRREQEDTKVSDFSLCHGSFGNSQIFHKFYLDTQEELFLEASNFWMDDGLKRLDLFLRELSLVEDYKLNSSIIDGLAGVGLSILSSITSDYSWNKSLLINN
jgi:lantibiotic modifying enzyme